MRSLGEVKARQSKIEPSNATGSLSRLVPQVELPLEQGLILPPPSAPQGRDQVFQHLSSLPEEGAIRLAFNKRVDAQAVAMTDGTEALYVDGKRIQVDPTRHHSPSSMIEILNACGSENELLDHLDAFRSLGEMPAPAGGDLLPKRDVVGLALARTHYENIIRDKGDWEQPSVDLAVGQLDDAVSEEAMEEIFQSWLRGDLEEPQAVLPPPPKGVYLGIPIERIRGTTEILRHFRAFLASESKEMRDPTSGGRPIEQAILDKDQARARLTYLINVAINRKAGVPDVAGRKQGSDYQRWLLQDAGDLESIRTRRVRIYQFRTPEIRARLSHLLSDRHED